MSADRVSTYAREAIASLILERLTPEVDRMSAEFSSPGRIASTWVDDLLPSALAQEIYQRFPSTDQMMLKRSIKEHKHVAAQMDNYDPLLEESVYAFQDPQVVELIARVTGLKGIEPDTELYAGGISLMAKGGYLRPHLDNSHDGRQARYRVLNLLYYVTPGWREEYGGSLQLWVRVHIRHRVPYQASLTAWFSWSPVTHRGTRSTKSITMASVAAFQTITSQPSRPTSRTTSMRPRFAVRLLASRTW